MRAFSAHGGDGYLCSMVDGSVGLTRDYWTTNNAGPLLPAHCLPFGTAVVTRLVNWRSGGLDAPGRVSGLR
jgi:hypothetical protein